MTTVVCVAIIAAVAIPTAAMAAVGTFTSTTVTPAVTGTNSATVANAKGVVGSATNTNANARWGVVGTAGGVNGVGVQGTGAKYGVFSNGNLGVAAGKTLTCAGCVTRADIASNARPTRAYAYVDSDGTVQSARSFNISVVRIQVGGYCINVTGADPATIAPIVSISDTPYIALSYTAEVTFDSGILSAGCAVGNDFLVIIRRSDTSALADDDFTIMVP